MKLLTILLLATITCLGQSDSIDKFISVGKIGIAPNSQFKFNEAKWVIDEDMFGAIMESFIEDYQEYTAECGESERCYEVYVRYTRTPKMLNGIDGYILKSDTTYFPCGNNIDPGFAEGYKGTITKTVKNRATFTGFMEWLERKYK